MQLPDDSILLAYLDGELDPAARQELERELAGSWELRAKLAAIERDIENCMQLLAATPQPAFPPAEAVWERLQPCIGAAEKAQKTAMQWRRWAVAASVVVAVLTAVVWFSRAPALSASDIVARASRMEAERLRRVPHPVTHRKMQVQRVTAKGTQAVQWELWTEMASGRTRERVAADVAGRAALNELRRVLDDNHLDSARPLSATAWANWRKSVAPRDEKLERQSDPDNGETISIETDLDGSGEAALVAARLTVRASDWQPVRETFTVNAPDGSSTFEIRQTESAVVAFDTLPRELFDDAGAGPPAMPPTAQLETAPAPATMPVVEPAVEAVDPEDLAKAATQVNVALHRAGLCGEGVLPELAASEFRLDVRGGVATLEHKARLFAVLEEIPLLRLDLQLRPQAEPSTAPAPAAIQRLLRERDSEAAVASLRSLLAAIRADAAALAWHVRWAGDGEAEKLPLRQVIEHHVTALRANLTEAAGLLEPGGAGGPPGVPLSGMSGRGLRALAAAVLQTCSDENLAVAEPAVVRAELLNLSAAAR